MTRSLRSVAVKQNGSGETNNAMLNLIDNAIFTIISSQTTKLSDSIIIDGFC